MNDFGSWAQGSRYYEQLKAMVGMKEFGQELRVLDVMNMLEL